MILYKRTRFVISGKTCFPLTLLTVEQAIPAREADAHMITLCSYTIACQIELHKFSLDGSKANNEEWARFGWEVISDEGT